MSHAKLWLPIAIMWQVMAVAIFVLGCFLPDWAATCVEWLVALILQAGATYIYLNKLRKVPVAKDLGPEAADHDFHQNQ